MGEREQALDSPTLGVLRCSRAGSRPAAPRSARAQLANALGGMPVAHCKQSRLAEGLCCHKQRLAGLAGTATRQTAPPLLPGAWARRLRFWLLHHSLTLGKLASTSKAAIINQQAVALLPPRLRSILPCLCSSQLRPHFPVACLQGRFDPAALLLHRLLRLRLYREHCQHTSPSLNNAGLARVRSPHSPSPWANLSSILGLSP